MKLHYTLLILSLYIFQFIGLSQINPNGTIDNIGELTKKDTIYIPMSDGTLLATTIAIPVFQDSVVTVLNINNKNYPIQIIPKNTQYVVYDSVNITPQSYELPIIFTRTPYNMSSNNLGSKIFPFMGFAYAIQDMRGRFKSEGVYFPMYSDAWPKEVYHPLITIPMDITNSTDPNNALKQHDGSQSIYYLADSAVRIADVDLDGIIDTIPYSNGKIGLFGASALGNSQYQALSDMSFTKPNPVKCFMPIVATNEHYNTTLFHNGVFRNSLVNGWIIGQLNDINNGMSSIDSSIYNAIHSPRDYGYSDKIKLANDLIDWFVSDKFQTSPSGAYPTSLLRKDLDASMAPINAQGYSDANGSDSRYKNLDVPGYHLTGWWDIFINGQIETFNRIRQANPGTSQKLVIGPWTHGTIGTEKVGDVTYPDNVYDVLNIDANFNPSTITTDSNLINNLYKSEFLTWYRVHLGGDPYFIIPESSQWQKIDSNFIRIPSKDYVIPYYKFLNYLGGESALKNLPIEIKIGSTTTATVFNLPKMDSSLIHLTEPLTAPDMNHFNQIKAIRMYITGPTNDPNNIYAGNYWLATDSFPFRTEITARNFYLHQDSTSDGNKPTQQEGTLSYISDPMDPVRTIGGNNMIVTVPNGTKKSQGPMNLANPVYDTLTMDRKDVIGFVSKPFNEARTFIGFPKAGIYAKAHTTTYNTSKTDFDIMVRILDVYPDGREILITEGTVNAKARKYAKSIAKNDTDETIQFTNIDNDTYYYFKFNLLPLGHVFGKGHQIKFLLSSSNYPKYQSNPNIPTEDGEFFRWTPGDTSSYLYQGNLLKAQDAKITFDFNPSSPSYIMLPQYDTTYMSIRKNKKQLYDWKIYPNPAKKEVNITLDNPVKGSIQLYTLRGKLIQTKKISKDKKHYQLDIQQLIPGIYLIKIPELDLAKKLIIH